MFSLGKAMSGAPICKGMMKLPNAPVSSGTIAKKTMIVPCIAPKELYKSGDITPSLLAMSSPRIRESALPTRGIGWPG